MKQKLILVIMVVTTLLVTGCAKTLENEDNKPVIYKESGQRLTSNIICQPENTEIIKLYQENGVDIEKLPQCDDINITSSEGKGVWETIFVIPLSSLIIFFGSLVGNSGLGLILAAIVVRILLMPITLNSAKSMEKMKKVRPYQQKIEEKYIGKKDRDSLMKKQQEIAMLYKKHDINLAAGCIMPLVQMPLFFAFYESIYRIPKLFEGKFLGLELGITPATAIADNRLIYLLVIGLVGFTTYINFKKTQENQGKSKDPLAKAQQKQMKLTLNIFLVMILMASFNFSTALSLYWITSNTFSLVQQQIVKKLVLKNE